MSWKGARWAGLCCPGVNSEKHDFPAMARCNIGDLFKLKVTCCSSEIQMELGVLYFYSLNLASLILGGHLMTLSRGHSSQETIWGKSILAWIKDGKITVVALSGRWD